MLFLCFSPARHFTRFHELFGFESHARVNKWNIRIYRIEDILPCAHFIFLAVATWFDISRESNKLSGDMNYVRFGNRNAERNNLYRNKYSIQLNTKTTHTQRSRRNVWCTRWRGISNDRNAHSRILIWQVDFYFLFTHVQRTNRATLLFFCSS